MIFSFAKISTKTPMIICYHVIGDNMKKTLFLSLISLLLGAFIGDYLYDTYQEKVLGVFKNYNTYYFIQEGVYSSEEIMNENIKNISNKIIDYKDNKYYVYLGITTDIANVEKIKNIYEEMGYQLYVKEINLSNEEFYNNVSQFDLLIKNSSKDEEILTIEEVVLANYEELIKKA